MSTMPTRPREPRLSRWLAAWLLLLLVAAQPGCNAGKFWLPGSGRIEVQGRWPSGQPALAAKLIPAETAAILVRLSGTGLDTPRVQRVNRSAAGPDQTFTIVFESVPLGLKTMDVTLLDGAYSPFYSTQVQVAVEGGKTVEAVLELNVPRPQVSLAPSASPSASVSTGLIPTTTPSPTPTPAPAITAGTQSTFTGDGVSFKMVFVPGKTFPIKENDSGTATVSNAYWVGETEVTYELWDKVYTWAIANGYNFANAGTMGDGSGDTNQHPVTVLNWRDAMVWSNAATEWYNAKNGTNYTPVYTYGGAIIRDARDANAAACDGAVASSSATGFRLPSSNEWELAARWRIDATNTVSGYSDPYFTKGNSVSGATADYTNVTATGAVAWYLDNSGSSTHAVKGKTANALGLYDMSGNVWEWCFDWYTGSLPVFRGGGWRNTTADSMLSLGYVDGYPPYYESDYFGFRLARNNVTPTPLTASAISAWDGNTCALNNSGGVQCWGENGYGQLGNGNTTWSSTPVAVSGLTSSITAIALGWSYSCALNNSGSVQCLGYNDYGQLGNGTTTTSYTPVAVNGLTSGITAIAAGNNHTCALNSSGSVLCWGRNNNGQLGNGTTTDSSTPVAVSGLTSGIIAIEAGGFHTCALNNSGGALCWGYNGHGELGNGTPTDSSTPVAVNGLTSGITAISAGFTHTCALNSSGGVQCWGWNSDGQLGNGGAKASFTTPVAVSGLTSGITAIATGSRQTCAVTSSGGVQCWGQNILGQLGNGTTTDSSTPVAVSGLSSGITAIATGYDHTCALNSSGGVLCWGFNSNGQLGNGTTTDSTTPVSVIGFGP